MPPCIVLLFARAINVGYIAARVLEEPQCFWDLDIARVIARVIARAGGPGVAAPLEEEKANKNNV